MAAGRLTVEGARAALEEALGKLRSTLANDSGVLTSRAMALVERSAVRTRPMIASPAPLVASGAVQSARSPNLLVELTHFIIARARQEVVVGYLTHLYRIGANDTLIGSAFPETFRLMRGLAGEDGTRLSATAAGRLPLNVWRATIAEDYARLPIRLVQNLCRVGSGCARQLGTARPALYAAERLLAGEPVFDVLAELPSRLRFHQVDSDGRLRSALAHGTSIVAVLADAVRVQGIADADPIRHPYILTARALPQMPDAQRQAFLRLLLLHAVPDSVASIQVEVDPLLRAAERAVRAVEDLGSTDPDSTPASAGRLVRRASDAFLAGFAVADALVPESDRQPLEEVRTRWEAVFQVLEPMAAGDYSLVMARTVTLVHTLGGGQVAAPGPVLGLMGLASGLASARSSADAQAAFESAAAPVGVWQEKRYQQGSSHSVTAFPGVAAGWEWLNRDGSWSDRGQAVGVALPVGLEFQIRLRRGHAQRDSRCPLQVFCSVGLFLPVIDLGALATYRVSNMDSAAVAPNTNLRQVFAPGAYLSLGIGRTPFALLAGAQMMPALRRVPGDEPETSTADAIRAGVAVALDVTLLRF